MLDQDEVVELYTEEMKKRGIDIGDPKAELDQADWDCDFKCLSDCPLPPGQDCIWDDPDFPLDVYEYPPHFFWRVINENLVQPEPKDLTAYRCPRCLSTKIDIGYPYIRCLNCGYDEPLIDFPVSYYYHLTMLKGLGEIILS